MRKRDLKYLEHARLGTGEFSALNPPVPKRLCSNYYIIIAAENDWIIENKYYNTLKCLAQTRSFSCFLSI